MVVQARGTVFPARITGYFEDRDAFHLRCQRKTYGAYASKWSQRWKPMTDPRFSLGQVA
jgi:hypothetical protein